MTEKPVTSGSGYLAGTPQAEAAADSGDRAGVIRRPGPAVAGVVVPAHNEEDRLGACLAAVREAARAVEIPVHMIVAADACTDNTAAVAAARGVLVAGLYACNAGAARAAGATELLRRMAATDPAAIWLATTDADTIVPPGWLHRQLSYAAQGWDVVLGSVTATDWNEHPPNAPAVFTATPESGTGPRADVSGVNLGIRASAYIAAGGFQALRTGEEHALFMAATRARCQILQASDISVLTAARRRVRVHRGFSDLLYALGREPDRGIGVPY